MLQRVNYQLDGRRSSVVSSIDRGDFTCKKLRYRRGTARRHVSVEILSTAAQLVKKITFERPVVRNYLEGDSRSSELHLFDRQYITFYLWSVYSNDYLAAFPIYYHIQSVRDWL